MIDIATFFDIARTIFALALIVYMIWPKGPDGWTARRWKILRIIMAFLLFFQLGTIFVFIFVGREWLFNSLTFLIFYAVFESSAATYREKVREEEENAKK